MPEGTCSKQRSQIDQDLLPHEERCQRLVISFQVLRTCKDIHVYRTKSKKAVLRSLIGKYLLPASDKASHDGLLCQLASISIISCLPKVVFKTDLAGVVVGIVPLGILVSHCGQQKCPALLVNGLMIKWPCNGIIDTSFSASSKCWQPLQTTLPIFGLKFGRPCSVLHPERTSH